MVIYHYHPVNGEFLGQGEADQSPLEINVFLIPAYATDVQPPTAGENQAAIFNDGAWSIVDDFRGVVYWDNNGRHLIDSVGVVVPEGASLTEPTPSVEDQPISITPRQGIEMLIEYDLYDSVTAYLNGLEGKEGAKARNRFDKATEYLSNDPLVIAIATAQGMTAEQIRQMFVEAKLLP